MGYKPQARRILILSAATLAGFPIYVGQPWGQFSKLLEWLVFSLVAGVTNWLPFLIIYMFTTRAKTKRMGRIGLGILFLMFIFMTYAFALAFFFHPDAQSGLIFIGLPMLLIPASIVLGGVCQMVDSSYKD